MPEILLTDNIIICSHIIYIWARRLEVHAIAIMILVLKGVRCQCAVFRSKLLTWRYAAKWWRCLRCVIRFAWCNMYRRFSLIFANYFVFLFNNRKIIFDCLNLVGIYDNEWLVCSGLKKSYDHIYNV